ncbi:MAG: hypothetical protein MZW92_72215 [Comamonadaceae bacterium]|nr:hypothetical protein [Comamonadaceae bacterium]
MASSHLSVGLAGTVRDPDPAAGLQHRVQRGDQAAGRHDQMRFAVAQFVHVRLAVADHQQLTAAQAVHDMGAQPVAGPGVRGVHDRSRLRLLRQAGDSERSGQPIAFAGEPPRDGEFDRRPFGDVASAHLPHPFRQPVK